MELNTSEKSEEQNDLLEEEIFSEDDDSFLVLVPMKRRRKASNWFHADMMTLLVGFFVMLQSFSKPDTQLFEKIKGKRLRFLESTQFPYEKLYKNLDDIIKMKVYPIRSNLKSQMKGLCSPLEAHYFLIPEKCNLKSKATNLLEKLVPRIYEQAHQFNIVIEGHTDDVPMHSRGIVTTNWELSSLASLYCIKVFFKIRDLNNLNSVQSAGRYKTTVSQS